MPAQHTMLNSYEIDVKPNDVDFRNLCMCMYHIFNNPMIPEGQEAWGFFKRIIESSASDCLTDPLMLAHKEGIRTLAIHIKKMMEMHEGFVRQDEISNAIQTPNPGDRC